MAEITQKMDDLRRELNAARSEITRLSDENHLYRDIADLQNVYICRYTPDLKLVYANRAYSERLGVEPETLIGRSFLEWIPEDEHVIATQRIERLTPELPTAVSVQKSLRADGSVVWMEWSDTAIRDQDGMVTGYQAIGRDVTVEKQTLFALERSRDRFSQIFSSIPVAIAIMSVKDRIFLDVNEAFLQACGYLREEVIGRTERQLSMLLKPLPLESIVEQMNNREIAYNELRFRRKSGEIRHGLLSAAVIELDGTPCILLTVQDITEQKQVQAREQANSRYLRAIVAATDELIMIQDDNLFEQRVVELMRESLGAERSALFLIDEDNKIVRGTYGTNQHRETVDEHTLEIPLQLIDELFKQSDTPWQLRSDLDLTYWDGQEMQSVGRGWAAATMIRVGGKRIGFLANDSVLSGMQLDPTRQEAIAIFASLLGNIIQRRRTEKTLRLTDQRYRVLVESSQAVIAMVALDGTVLYVNDLGAKSVNKTVHEVIGKKVEDIYPPERAAIIRQSMQSVVTSGLPIVYESQSVINGELRLFSSMIYPIRDENRQISAVMLNAFDITPIRQAQDALRESEERYRKIVETANEGIWLSDNLGRVLYVNDRMAEMLGYTADELIGTSVFEYVDPFYRDLMAVKVRERLQGRRDQYDFVFRRKDGGELWVSISATPFISENNHTSNILAMVTDITERKLAEQALQAANNLLEERIRERTVELEQERNLLRTLIDSIPDMIYAKDLDHRCVLSNMATAKMLGCQHPSEVIGKTDADFYSAELAELFMQEDKQIFASGEALINVEHFGLGNSGTVAWGSTTKVPLRSVDGGMIGLVGITRDITEHRQTQIALEQKYEEEKQIQGYLRSMQRVMIEFAALDDADALYRRVVEYARFELDFDRFALFLYDPEHARALGTFGVDVDGEISDERGFTMVIQPNTILDQAQKNLSMIQVEEHTMLYYESKPVGYGWNAAVALNHGDELFGWIIADNFINRQPLKSFHLEIMAQYAVLIGSSISRMRINQSLRNSEARFRQLIDTMGGGVTIYDQENKLIYINERMCDIIGYRSEEVLGLSYDQLNEKFVDQTFQPIALEHGQLRSKGTSTTYETRLIRKDRRRLTMLVNGSPMFDGNGTSIGSFAVAVDITQQKEAEETLRRSLEREQELGKLKSQFVSTTSHEFRTPLAVIQATTETLMRFRDRMDADQMNARLEKIRGQVYHLRQIMDDVLHLAKIQARGIDFKPIIGDLRSLMEDVIEGFNNSSENPDRVQFTTTATTVRLAHDPRLMRQILINIMSNALKYSKPETRVDVSLERIDSQVQVRIQDYGMGIPPESLPHIFEPFHRADNVDTISGTGLGMAIVKEAVEIHGGKIEVSSVLNQGTIVTVTLPLHIIPASADEPLHDR